MKKSDFTKLLRECIEEVLMDQPDDANDPLYIAYVRDLKGETPFTMNGEKFQYVMGQYPDGKVDIGVYSFSNDLVYGYKAFKRMYNINEGKKKKWIQKAIDPKHKGYCTPMTKSTCTPRRKALAKRFKKGLDEGLTIDFNKPEYIAQMIWHGVYRVDQYKTTDNELTIWKVSLHSPTGPVKWLAKTKNDKWLYAQKGGADSKWIPFDGNQLKNENFGGFKDPTKEEMIQYLTSIYGDESKDDMESAIYWFANDYHGGQWSNLYSVLSTSPFKPGRLSRGPEEDSIEKMMYQDLEDKFGNTPSIEKETLTESYLKPMDKYVYPIDFKLERNYIRIVNNVADNEYIVAWYENGKIKPNKSYFTNDLSDAMETFDSLKNTVDVANGSSDELVKEMTSTGAVAGYTGKNWVDPDKKRTRMKAIASKSVGGNVVEKK